MSKRHGWLIALLLLVFAGCGQPHGRPLYARVVTDITVANVSVQSLDVSPDGKYLAIGGQDSMVRIWPLPDLQYTGSLFGHPNHVWCVRFSPDGTLLASSSGLFEKSPIIRIWKVPSGVWVRTLPGDERNIVSLAFHPAGDWLASAECRGFHLPQRDKGAVRLWSVSDDSVLRVLDGHTDAVYGLACAPDGRQLAGACVDGSICLWNTDDWTSRVLPHRHGHAACAVAYSPDGQVLASAGLDGVCKLWPRDGDEPIHVLEGHTGSVRSVAFDRSGRVLATGSADNSIRIWSVKTGELLSVIDAPNGTVHALVFDHDDRLISGTNDGHLRVWVR